MRIDNLNVPYVDCFLLIFVSLFQRKILWFNIFLDICFILAPIMASLMRESTPEDLGGYADKLGAQFIDNFDRATALNPARYFSTKCHDLCDRFLDQMSAGGHRSTQFTVSQFGDEIQPTPKETEQSGDKRTGSELEGPDRKKRRLDDSEHKDNADGMDSDDDIDMDSDDEDKPKKKGKRKKRKLPEKYKDDEDFQSLEAPRETASTADEFFDPINHCKINLDRESRMSTATKDRINKYQMIGGDDVDINAEHIKYINRNHIDRYIKETGNSNGYTVQQDISTMMCLGLQDHLKNLFDEMEKWRRMRMDQYGQQHRQRGQIPIKYSGTDAQGWMDSVNSKYAKKQQIIEAQDEVQTLDEELAELKVRKLTSILTPEEEKRLAQLPNKLAAARQKQKDRTEKPDQFNVSAMKALGGDFTFGSNKKKVKELRGDKYYVIDVVNMLGAHQRMNQQHLKQLSRLHLKQTS